MQAHAANGAVQSGHVGDDDVQHGLARSLDTELGLSTNQGGADIEIVAGLVARQPPGTIDREERKDELLELSRVKDGERDAASREQHTSTVTVRAEGAQLAIIAAVDLEALETLGGVVQDRRSGHEAQGTVGLDLGGTPASSGSPGSSEHVVSADGMLGGIGDGLIGDFTGVLCEVVGELGGIKGSRDNVIGGRLGGLSGLLDLDVGGRQVDILSWDSGGSHCCGREANWSKVNVMFWEQSFLGSAKRREEVFICGIGEARNLEEYPAGWWVKAMENDSNGAEEEKKNLVACCTWEGEDEVGGDSETETPYRRAGLDLSGAGELVR